MPERTCAKREGTHCKAQLRLVAKQGCKLAPYVVKLIPVGIVGGLSSPAGGGAAPPSLLQDARQPAMQAPAIPSPKAYMDFFFLYLLFVKNLMLGYTELVTDCEICGFII